MLMITGYTPDDSALDEGSICPDRHRSFDKNGDIIYLKSVNNSIVLFCEQAFQYDDDVAPFLCGFTSGSEALLPGGEEWFEVTLDDKICPDGALFTLAGMLGEL